MLYKLLGMIVWKGARTVLRQKYGPGNFPVPVVAAALVGLLVAVALVLFKRDSD